MQRLTAPLTAAFGLLLTAYGHVAGWPVVEGGSVAIGEGLAAEVRRLGGVVHTECLVGSLEELPRARAVLLDLAPRQFLQLAGDAVPEQARRSWARFRAGRGTCKVDWALNGLVPWNADVCRRTVKVHVGGTFEEVERSEAAVAAGMHPEHPFVVVAQPCVVDSTRAPEGRYTLWGYCHVPNGSGADMSERMEAQIERFAPGFRDLVLARSVRRLKRRLTIPTSSEVTSAAVRRRYARRCSGRSDSGTPAAPRSMGSTSAPHRPCPEVACTACAGNWPRTWR